MNINPFTQKDKSEAGIDKISDVDYQKFIDLREKAIAELLRQKEEIELLFTSRLSEIEEKLEKVGYVKPKATTSTGKRIRRSFPKKSSEEIKAELTALLKGGAKPLPEILKALNIPASRLKEFIDSGFLKHEGQRRGRKYLLHNP